MWLPKRLKEKIRGLMCWRGGIPAGFTLLELLVALAILSVLATVLFLTVGASATQTRRIGERFQEQQRLRFVFQKMASDFSGVFWDKEAAHLYFQGTRGNVTGGRSDRLEFTSVVYHWRYPGERTDELVAVTYSLKPGSIEKGGSLVREEKSLTTEFPGNYGEPLDILSGVKEVWFSYVDAEKQEKDDWSTRSSGEGVQGLPKAVRVFLKLKRGEGERTVSALFPLPLGVRPPQVAGKDGSTGAPGGS